MISPRILLHAHQIRADKQLGQHFLSDRSVAEKIVAASRLSEKDIVLEIGAGLGALTIPAAQRIKKIYAVEKDPRIMRLLKTAILSNRFSNIVFIQKNILSVDLAALGREENQEMVVLGNLPYNISSQILVRLIDYKGVIKRAVLMFQREVAQRMIAQPGGRDYGRLSVMIQYCAEINPLFEVKASCFFPKPEVDAIVVAIDFKPIEKGALVDEAFLFRVIKAAFGKRRKTLKNALAASELGIDGPAAFRALSRASIDPARRAETLTVSEFIRLSRSLKHLVFL